MNLCSKLLTAAEMFSLSHCEPFPLSSAVHTSIASPPQRSSPNILSLCQGRVGPTCSSICSSGYNPCQNGGACEIDRSVPRGYQCQCQPQYRGDYCQDKVMVRIDVIVDITVTLLTSLSPTCRFSPSRNSVPPPGGDHQSVVRVTVTRHVTLPDRKSVV